MSELSDPPVEPPPPVTLVELSRDDCFVLLRTVEVGRVAVARADRAPLVVPVNFTVDGDAVVFRTDSGTKLQAVTTGPIAFEADNIDSFRRQGWSVLLEGRAYVATHWEVGHLDVAPWAGGRRDHWVRLVPTEVSGRMIEVTPEVTDRRGYR